MLAFSVALPRSGHDLNHSPSQDPPTSLDLLFLLLLLLLPRLVAALLTVLPRSLGVVAAGVWLCLWWVCE